MSYEDPRPSAGELLGRIAGGDTRAATFRQLVDALVAGGRAAGRKAVGSGRLAADILVDAVGDVPVRPRADLVAAYGQTEPAKLASEVIRSASHLSALAGAASGAIAGASAMAPPAWAAIPLELLVGTLAEAVIELRMVGELHECYGRPLQGDDRERGLLLLRLWGEQRGVTAVRLLTEGEAHAAGLVAGGVSRDRLVELVKQQVKRRLRRNLVAVGPAFVGAAANAELNRRSARRLGAKVADDLHRSAGVQT